MVCTKIKPDLRIPTYSCSEHPQAMVHFAQYIFDDMDGTKASCRLFNALFTQTVHGSSVFLMLTQICRLKMVTAKIPGECEWTSASSASGGAITLSFSD